MYLRTGKHGDIDLEVDVLHNTKVTGSAIEERKSGVQGQKRNTALGHNLQFSQVVSKLLGVRQVHMSGKFVQVPSVPLEEHPGVLVHSPSGDGAAMVGGNICGKIWDIAEGGKLIGVEVRTELCLPVRRCFTNSQRMVMADQLFNKVSVDGITAFSVRPPALRFVRKVCDYLCWFSRRGHVKAKKMEGPDGRGMRFPPRRKMTRLLFQDSDTVCPQPTRLNWDRVDHLFVMILHEDG